MGSQEVKLPDGSHVIVTPDNYNDVARAVIQANPQFDRNQQLGVVDGLRGLANGGGPVNVDNSGAGAVLSQPFVALADLIAPPGGQLRSFFQTPNVQIVSKSGTQGLQSASDYVSDNAPGAAQAGLANAKNAGLAVVYGFADWTDDVISGGKSAAKKIGDALPNPTNLTYAILAIGAGLGALFIYVRYTK